VPESLWSAPAGCRGDSGAGVPALAGKRAKIVYKLTADGKEHFAELMSAVRARGMDDDSFGIRFAFFGRTDAAVRLRILEGRRRRLRSARTRSVPARRGAPRSGWMPTPWSCSGTAWTPWNERSLAQRADRDRAQHRPRSFSLPPTP